MVVILAYYWFCLFGVPKRYFAPALGVYLGWMLMALLFIGIITLALGSSGINLQGGVSATTNVELLSLLSTIGMPLLIVTLLFSYVQPLVQANIIMANDFKEGFFAVLTIFSADVWRRAMQGSYFKYISVYGTITLLAMFLFAFLFSIFASIPILNILILTIFVYIFSIIMSVSSVMAKRIVE